MGKGIEGNFFYMPPGLVHAITATKDLVFLLSMVKAKT
jgi:quercetin dioxygenase-like cupin family protein